MPKAASDVMQIILIAAVTEAIEALKAGARGLPNNLLRDVQSVHPNAAFTELPKGLQDSINLSVRNAFNLLLKEGYSVGPKGEMSTQRPIDRVPRTRPRTPRAERATVPTKWVGTPWARWWAGRCRAGQGRAATGG